MKNNCQLTKETTEPHGQFSIYHNRMQFSIEFKMYNHICTFLQSNQSFDKMCIKLFMWVTVLLFFSTSNGRHTKKVPLKWTVWDKIICGICCIVFFLFNYILFPFQLCACLPYQQRYFKWPDVFQFKKLYILSALNLKPFKDISEPFFPFESHSNGISGFFFIFELQIKMCCCQLNKRCLHEKKYGIEKKVTQK